jgi:hypothetical protein
MNLKEIFIQLLRQAGRSLLVAVEAKQSRYRPGVAQRVPRS